MAEKDYSRLDEEFNVDFPGADRHDYPEGIYCVTEGQKGGEATLITCGEKTVLHDCGHQYAADETIGQIKEKLGGRSLDYILVSHTHYDHIGALPQIRQAFPGVKVVGSAYGQYVFTRPGALKVIKELCISAAKLYSSVDESEITTEGMGIDIVLADGEKLDIGGGMYFVALETKGHTNCAMTYVLEPQKIMFSSESTGICVAPGNSNMAILKSYDDSMASLKKCREYGAKRIISPHYGIMPEYYNEEFWDEFIRAAREEKEYVVGMWNDGLSPEEMLAKASKELYSEARREEQPYEAFVANCKALFKVYEKYADEDKKYKDNN